MDFFLQDRPPLAVRPHWHRPASPGLALDGDIEVDVAVVGGGYAGLSAAYHAKRRMPGQVVALFEAGRIADGASGVNSGQCSPRIGPPIERQMLELGAEQAAACYRYSLQAMDEVAELVRSEGIACELAPSTQLQVALTGRQAAHLRMRGQLFERLGLDVRWVAPRALRDRLPATPGLTGALSYPVFGLNPSKLCAGLHRAAQQAGVQVYEGSKVGGIRWGRTHELQCRGHRVRARRLVIATDGATPTLGLLRTQLFPVRAFCAASAPLPAGQFEAVRAAELAGFYDARQSFNFVRFTPDRRILVGGEYRYARPGPVDHHPPALKLHQAFERFFPILAGVPFDAVWSGLLGCTLDGWPLIAPVGGFGNAWFAGGWNGHGVALATASGKTVAQCLAGEALAPRPWLRAKSASIPAACLAHPAIASYLAVQKFRDRIDRWGHRLFSSQATAH